MKRKSANGVALFLVENRPGAPSWPVPRAEGPEDAAVGELDHIVIRTGDAERAVALYGGRLGLDLRLDRINAQWGARQLFFRCGGAVVEIGASLAAPAGDAKDSFGDLPGGVRDPHAARDRIAAAGLDVSEVPPGPQAQHGRLHRARRHGRRADADAGGKHVTPRHSTHRYVARR